MVILETFVGILVTQFFFRQRMAHKDPQPQEDCKAANAPPMAQIQTKIPPAVKAIQQVAPKQPAGQAFNYANVTKGYK